MTATTEIVVVGSHGVGQVVRVERFPVPGETVNSVRWDVSPDGGKGSNQAIAAGRLGCRVAFIGVVGNDVLGDLGDEWMRAAGVDTRHLLRSPTGATSTGIVIVDASGQNSIINADGPEDELSPDDVAECVQDFAGASVLLTGFEIPVRTALAAAKLGKDVGMTTIVNPAPAPHEAMGDLSYVDVLVPNELEARSIAGAGAENLSSEEIARLLRDAHRPGAVIVTLGAEGSLGLDAEGLWRVQASPVPVVDTTGAGDAYCAALACGLSRDMDLRAASRWASRIAAVSVSCAGSIPSFPKLAEVDSEGC